MKISPVQQNYYRHYNYNNFELRGGGASKAVTTNVSVPQNKTIPSVSVPFTSLQTTALELAKKIPIEDRLASIIEVTKPDDMIVIDKSLKSAQKALKGCTDYIENIVKRFFYIEEDNMPGALVFFKNKNDELEVLNPNKFDIFLMSETEQSPMKFGESFYVLPDDKISLNGTEISIKDKPKVNLSMQRHLFSKVFDMTNDVKPAIKKQNLSSILSLVKSDSSKGKVLTFADVGGQDKVITDLKKGILYPVKYPDAYENTILNHGFIMYGPPGTGKTLIAQALANETNANFVKLNGLEMESKWVGESEENWRKLFEAARENQPSIIFIDEFDAVAKKRGGADVYGDKVVNQLLTLMSDVEKDGDNIFVIAATNKIDMLDSAITRSGRFGQHIEVKAPDTIDGILKIFDIHTRNKALDEALDKTKLAKDMLALKATGADIAHIVNNANENAFERAGIYTKMEDGTFTKDDINALRLIYDDFKQAIDAFSQSRNKNSRLPIGFNKS